MRANNTTSSQSSDSERERQQGINKRLEVLVGVLFIVLGLPDLVLRIMSKTPPSFIGAGMSLGLLVLLFIMLIQGVAYTKKHLEPMDEYEKMRESVAKAKAFNLLSTGIIFIILFSRDEWVLPLLYILLGSALIFAARKEVDGK